eukprot:6338266-Pyramimonas_sp.AAC.1
MATSSNPDIGGPLPDLRATALGHGDGPEEVPGRARSSRRSDRQLVPLGHEPQDAEGPLGRIGGRHQQQREQLHQRP